MNTILQSICIVFLFTYVQCGGIGRYPVSPDVVNQFDLYDSQRGADTEKFLSPTTIYLGLVKPQPGQSDYHTVLFATNEQATGGGLFQAEYLGTSKRGWKHTEESVTEFNRKELIGQVVLMISLGNKTDTVTYAHWMKCITGSLEHHLGQNNWDPSLFIARKMCLPISDTWAVAALMVLAKYDLIVDFIQIATQKYRLELIEDAHAFHVAAKMQASCGIVGPMVYVDHGPLRIRAASKLSDYKVVQLKRSVMPAAGSWRGVEYFL